MKTWEFDNGQAMAAATILVPSVRLELTLHGF
jgi:hypothetical protein